VVYCTNVIYGKTNVVSENFNVAGPTNATIQMITNSAGPIEADTNYHPYLGQWCLHYGFNGSNGSNPGITFTNAPAVGPTGTFSWVQIVNTDSLQTTDRDGSHGGDTEVSGLDGSYPYAGSTPSYAIDGPGDLLIVTDVYGYKTFSATMYLLWQCSPTLANGDNTVPVAIRQANWNVAGAATNTGTLTAPSWNIIADTANYTTNLNDSPATNQVQWSGLAH